MASSALSPISCGHFPFLLYLIYYLLYRHFLLISIIKRLIVHIPEKHFKMLRYYGIYAKHHKQESKLHKCISSEKHRYLCKFYNWQNMILLTFGYDPLKCPKCGKSMFAFEVYYKKTALFEQYRKVMGYG
ncbi:transposase [Dorea formicigenerans]|uniref:transposase n=1 Tax=Dorea formicigenerans TaxID=39486 RepID=UPI001868D37F